MTRTYNLPVISFGSEVQEPGLAELKSWVSDRRGRVGDIISFMLDRSLLCQNGISDPCLGGLFYAERILSCITGLSSTEVKAEPALDPELLRMDGRLVRSFGRYMRMAIPAPSMLGISDSYFEDEDEFTEEIARLFLAMMRLQRDVGVSGHVLITDQPGETETDILSSRRVSFYVPDPDHEALSVVMEHQRDIVLPAEKLPLFLDLLENYEIRSISLVDAKTDDLRFALEHFDMDEVSVGGYCMEGCDEYWPALVERSVITL